MNIDIIKNDLKYYKEMSRKNWKLYNQEGEKLREADYLLCDLLECGIGDIDTFKKRCNYGEKHDIFLQDVKKYLKQNLGEIVIEFNNLLFGIFRLLIEKFENENNLALEAGVDYDYELNYFCSKVYFNDEKLENKFNKWL